MHTITRTEWDALHPHYRLIENGVRYLLKDTGSGTALIPVTVSGAVHMTAVSVATVKLELMRYYEDANELGIVNTRSHDNVATFRAGITEAVQYIEDFGNEGTERVRHFMMKERDYTVFKWRQEAMRIALTILSRHGADETAD